MRPLTVLHALEKVSFATGSVWQMFEAARGLAQRGHRVLVATRPDAEMARRCREAGLVHLPLAFWNEFHRLVRQDLLKAFGRPHCVR